MGCQQAQDLGGIRQTATGFARATLLPAGKGPSACPRTPPGMQAATSGGCLFIISDSSACQGSALCRANRGLAHSCRKVLRKASRGKANAGIEAAPTIPDRPGGTFCGHSDSPCVACLLRSCSRPLSCSAARGQAGEAFFSRLRLHRGTRRRPVQGNKAFVSSPSCCWRLLREKLLRGHNYPFVDDTRISLSTPGPNCFRSV